MINNEGQEEVSCKEETCKKQTRMQISCKKKKINMTVNVIHKGRAKERYVKDVEDKIYQLIVKDSVKHVYRNSSL